jgi:hypothetical protein
MMSILDAMRVQRADNKSVRELAMLPQPEIIKLAQMGQIPADVVPVVISEKARMAQMVANMQAMQGGQQPTVIEQAMQQNANAESQQAGLPGLPTDGLFKEQNFQTGGIVGYNGQETSEVDVLANLIKEKEAGPDRPRTLEDLVAQGSRLRDPYLQQSQAEKDYATSLASAKMDPNQMLWMNLLKGGLKAAAGTSPYGLTNLASGLSEAAEGYGKDLESQRKLGLEQAKELAAQGRQSRLDQLSNIASAERLYEKTMDNEAAMTRALKATDISAFTDTFVKDAREKGSAESDAALKLKGQQEYLKLRYALDQATARANAAVSQAGAAVTGAGAQVSQAETAKADKAEQRKLEAQKIEEQKTKAALDRSNKRLQDEMESPGWRRLTPAQQAARKVTLDNEELASSGLPPIGPARPVATPAAPAAPSARGKTGQTYSPADIAFTAKKYNISEAEVKQRLGIK